MIRNIDNMKMIADQVVKKDDNDRNVQTLPVTPQVPPPPPPSPPPHLRLAPSANCQGSCPLLIQHFLVIDIIVGVGSNKPFA